MPEIGRKGISSLQTIVLTGGGSAGHVTPNLALSPLLRAAGYELAYIGSHTGIEKGLLEPLMPYYAISTGKLRRYFNAKNLTDPFRVVKGYFDALAVLRKLRPAALFSKGGYVAVPVVMAAKALKIPVIIHESDLSPGLATRLCAPYASVVCVTFPKTARKFKNAVVTGSAIRRELFTGQAEHAYSMFRLPTGKPLLLIMGGSLGSKALNEAVRGALPALLQNYSVVHLCGKGNLSAEKRAGYVQLEYADAELPHLLAAAALVVSRAGSNCINEFLALRLPMLLVPLSAKFSRGDQLENAEEFRLAGYADVLTEEKLTPETLVEAVSETFARRQELAGRMLSCSLREGTKNIANIILDTAGKNNHLQP